jgi:putative heme-binding domain-containing protein
MEGILETINQANPARGRELFLSGAGSCIVCHRVGENGGKVGPDLTSIGSIRGAKDLLESILYPDASIARDFDTVEVFEKGRNGTSRIGLLESDGIDSITLIDAAAQSVKIPRSRIESIVPLERSLMPPGLEQTLPENGLRDIVAFLLGQMKRGIPLEVE